jgi:transcriptional regulator with XRE-family HTH domain
MSSPFFGGSPVATLNDLIARWNGGKQKGAQTVLAKKLGISQSTVSRWMKGIVKPEADLRPRLAKVLGVSEGELNSVFPKEDVDSFRAMNEPVPVVAVIKDVFFDFSFSYRTGENADVAIPNPGDKKVAALRVQGGALKPEAEDGDVIIVVESGAEEIPNGGLALVRVKEKFTLLKIQRENGKVVAKLRGPKSKDLVLSPQGEGEVVGAARFLLKRFS